MSGYAQFRILLKNKDITMPTIYKHRALLVKSQNGYN